MSATSPAPRAGRAVRLAAGFLKGRPVWCSWQVTRRCASLCMFCDHRLEGADEELDLAGCARVSAGLAQAGALVVSLTGGEPFLRPDLAELVRVVAERHYPLLTTHGWLVTPAKARAVWQAGLEGATVRLHGARRERHDEAAGLAGAHARALDAVSSFTSERTRSAQRVHVKVRVGAAADLDGLEDLLEEAARRGASVIVEPGFPLGGGEAGLTARLLEIKRGHRNLRSSARYLARFDEALAAGVGGCHAGRAFLNVDHRGRVSKCVEFQGEADRVGDLTSEGWREVSPRLRREAEGNGCRACWHASRGEVEGLYSARGLVSALPALLRS
ncbi:MAG TPA: radical SAM protein [Vicinamibacteria bacterium]|nr:radical SAM protein [Vicinamibacteria bacterium]